MHRRHLYRTVVLGRRWAMKEDLDRALGKVAEARDAAEMAPVVIGRRTIPGRSAPIVLHRSIPAGAAAK